MRLREAGPPNGAARVQGDAAPGGSSDPDRPPHVVVLGAGVCGLYAARVLSRAGLRVTLLEREAVVGGLAAGHERGGNFYDLGVHHLHAFDRQIFEDIRGLMGERLVPVPKRALIRYGRGYRRYPLELKDMLLGIPPLVLARALLGLVAQQVRNRWAPMPVENAEEALVELYGRPLYRFFFADFTRRYWGQPPATLSAGFVRRKMPRLSAVDLVKKALARFGLQERSAGAVESATAEETLWYGRTGARDMPMALADAIAAAGGAILLESPVVALEAEGGRIRAVRYRRAGVEQRLPCDACLSTIPLPLLARLLEPAAPEAVLAAAARLRHRPMVVYGLLVRRPRILEALYVYYRDRVFHRLAEPGQSGMQVQPAGHSVLLVEVMCRRDDAFWRASPEALAQVVADLEAEGLLSAEEIVETHCLRAEHAYPVFDLGFEAQQAEVEAHLAGFANLRSTGRQGAFCYPNMHTSMRMGAEAAQGLAAELEAGAPAALARGGAQEGGGAREARAREAQARRFAEEPVPEGGAPATAGPSPLPPAALPAGIPMPDGDQRGALPAVEVPGRA